MPKLDKETIKQIEESESTFELVPDGIYVVSLLEVDAKGEGPKGPYWKWIFQIPEGVPYAKRQFFHTTSRSDKASWRFKEVYKAFGAPLGSETDNLLGKKIRVKIGHHTIDSGPREGEEANEVDRLFPYNPEEEMENEDAFK